MGGAAEWVGSRPFDPVVHARHVGLANTVFARFVEETMAECIRKCMHDVQVRRTALRD